MVTAKCQQNTAGVRVVFRTSYYERPTDLLMTRNRLACCLTNAPLGTRVDCGCLSPAAYQLEHSCDEQCPDNARNGKCYSPFGESRNHILQVAH